MSDAKVRHFTARLGVSVTAALWAMALKNWGCLLKLVMGSMQRNLSFPSAQVFHLKLVL
ncbi:MAG: hypothetical protein ACYC1F_10830 [Gallionellaceae bacterium]